MWTLPSGNRRSLYPSAPSETSASSYHENADSRADGYTSWPPQAGHTRLAVLISASGVNGGPAAAMTCTPASSFEKKHTIEFAT
jgi:hypothetical protein